MIVVEKNTVAWEDVQFLDSTISSQTWKWIHELPGPSQVLQADKHRVGMPAQLQLA